MDKKKSVALLNKAIGEELLAIEQYLYFHFHCEDRGYDPLAKIFQRISVVEMMHMDKLAKRVLFLDGDVEMKIPSPVKKINKSVEEMLVLAKKLEDESAAMYNEMANEAAKNSDHGTKVIFESLVSDEEDHYDIFDTEIKNLDTFGDSYLALQSIDRSKKSGKGES